MGRDNKQMYPLTGAKYDNILLDMKGDILNTS